MGESKGWGRWSRPAILGLTIVGVTAGHMAVPVTRQVPHDLFVRLYYLPIALGGVWFGLWGGLAAAGFITALYLPHILFVNHGDLTFGYLLEIPVFVGVGLLTGLIVERQAQYRRGLESQADTLARSHRELQEQTRLLLDKEVQLRRADRLSALGQLSAGLAHEIRNPLGAIKGAVEILEEDFPAGHPKAEFYAIVLKEVKRLNDVVTNFLNFARPVSPAVRAGGHPGGARRSGGVDFRPGARAPGADLHQLSRRARRASWRTRRCSKQAFLNIMLNALEAMPEGGDLAIATRLADAKTAGVLEPNDRDEWLEVVFDDTGTGIPEAHLGRVFDPFFTTKKDGTGSGARHHLPHRRESSRDHPSREPTREGHHVRDHAPAGRKRSSMKRIKILVIDDDESLRRVLEYNLAQEGYAVLTAASGEQGLELLKKEGADLVLTDVRMPGMNGLQVMEEVRKLDAKIQVIILTAFGTIETAVEAMKAGAFHYISKPFNRDELKLTIRKALELEALQRENVVLRQALKSRSDVDSIVADSPGMRQIVEMIRRVAPTETTVLILGESGTGKELVARAIHGLSSRSRGPFVAVNCAAIPENLLESELFGHVKGAFTGAIRDRMGKFEAADGGTIFLDEIGEMRPELQVKILRSLEERTVERVGDNRPIRVDVRVLAATNKDLTKAIEAGEFREDLYYRLNVVPLTIPPLRERREDIRALTQHFLKSLGAPLRLTIAPDAFRALETYDWPGNVRELENALERALIFHRGDVISGERPAGDDPVAEDQGIVGARRQPARGGALAGGGGEGVDPAGSPEARLEPVARGALSRHHAAHALVPDGQARHRAARRPWQRRQRTRSRKPRAESGEQSGDSEDRRQG